MKEEEEKGEEEESDFDPNSKIENEKQITSNLGADELGYNGDFNNKDEVAIGPRSARSSEIQPITK